MNHAATTSVPPFSLSMPSAALEIGCCLLLLVLSTLAFVLGILTLEAAQVLTVATLAGLVVLAWIRFDQGRHPCFLFLCTLLLFQGGRLLSWCVGGLPDPLRIELMTVPAFSPTLNEAGLTLLLLALSAICIYTPCRWHYSRVTPPASAHGRRYLPYLYLLFYGSLPIQFFKNYHYYQYAQDHGGYVSIFLRHGDLAASVPMPVRIISLISFPAFVALFVLEKRKKFLIPATILYFATATVTLLLGSRGGIFGLILTLWYVTRIKSRRKARVLVAAAMVILLMLVADVIQAEREDPGAISNYTFLPVDFVASQGASLSVTEVAVKYRSIFAPYWPSYLLHELEAAFVASDTSNYFRGKTLPTDIPVFLDPTSFSEGHGTGSSYLAEGYVIGGLLGVAIISLLIGFGLHWIQYFSRREFSLFLVAMILPDVLLMPRSNLLDWLSVFVRNAISVVLLFMGWRFYRLIASLKGQQHSQQSSQAT